MGYIKDHAIIVTGRGGECGYYNDECVCIHNEVATAIKEVFSL
jgi:hypothetical protein